MGRIKGKGDAFAKKLRDWVSETSGLLANKQLRPAPAMSGPRQSRNIEALSLRSTKTSTNTAPKAGLKAGADATKQEAKQVVKQETKDKAKNSGQKGAKENKDHVYYSKPEKLKAFPEAAEVNKKTPVQGGGKLRTRWADKKHIYEWDSRHGVVEKYNKQGKHLGKFDANTGQQLKPSKLQKISIYGDQYEYDCTCN